MKTTHSLLILMAVMSLVACKDKKEPELKSSELPITIYSNNIHVITLYVNTAEINNGNIDEYANFGQPDSISNEDYITHVRKGDIVIWKGVSVTDPLDIVNISSINHQGGPKLFNKNLLKGNGGDDEGANEVVIGVVTKGPEMKDGISLDKEKYVLHFKVKRNGKPQVQPYKIDPYIKVSQ
ncbi:hypothetical protein [uncultured Muriicola sp.]|uniref:hypothetical protein n=1 Tax=uncultured Muriicola sp. TaxID=1583102 RepID=UPI002630F89F|nr:hypothetical protein [uncultured Muriicola sp.]